jgi:hypothetical protein
MTKMRAKLRVGAVMPLPDGAGGVAQERVSFHGVAKSGSYPDDGSDENNTYAKFSPSAVFDIVIANPALIGQFAVGDTFYVDFTPAE